MKTSVFIRDWTIVTLISAMLISTLYQWDNTKSHVTLGWYCMLIFSFLSFVVYFLGKKTVDHPIRTRFIGVTIVNMMLKMFISIAIVFTYYKIEAPDNPFFILPFIIIYILYTIFETRFLLLIADQKKAK